MFSFAREVLNPRQMPRTVAVVTGSRAEYGLIQPIMRALKESTDYRLQAAPC